MNECTWHYDRTHCAINSVENVATFVYGNFLFGKSFVQMQMKRGVISVCGAYVHSNVHANRANDDSNAETNSTTNPPFM